MMPLMWTPPYENVHYKFIMRKNFAQYHFEHPIDTYWMPYEELKRDSAVLVGLFDFLGLPFEESYLDALNMVLR